MASITKRIFLFVLAGSTFAAIAGAQARGALSVERQAPPKRFAQASGASAEVNRQSAIGNRQSAISLSVPFIQNRGQLADSQVLFYARTFGGTVYVTADGQLVYALPRSEDSLKRTTDDGRQTSAVKRSAVIREMLVDADPVALPAGAERSGVVINSFVGNDRSRWQANLPSFKGVQFGDVYEGIALEVRATGDNVEKIFTVAPGADPARIALRLDGAAGVSITPAGELEARTALGPVRFTAPVAYQTGASGERQSVSVAYALEGDQIGFCVGAFDAARPLVIDPLLASTFIGGTSGDSVIRALALDSQTNVLAAGYTASLDFPATNSYDTSYNGGSSDGFIARFDSQLTNLLAATYLGGAGEDAIMAMAVNPANGAVCVAGYTASTDFPMQTPRYGTYRGGAYDAFVSVLDGNLSGLAASTYLGGTNVDQVQALALNVAGDIYVAGYTDSGDFPTSAGAFRTTLAGANDAFVTKQGALGSFASTFVGGNGNDEAFGLAIATNGLVYLAGSTASTNFPATPGCYQPARSGAGDAFVAQLSAELNNIAAATYLGGTGSEAARGIALAPFTNIVCVVGYTDSANYPRNPSDNVIAPGYTNRYRGGRDAVLTRLNLSLSNVLASTYMGGTGDEEATAVLAVCSTNAPLRIYMSGWTASTNFPVTPSAYNTAANGGRDAFISCWSTGNTLLASTYLGGSANDSAYAVALQADRFSLFLAGATFSSNFPATVRAYNNDRTGRTNNYGFVTRLGAGLDYGTKKWQVAMDDPDDEFAIVGSPSLGWDGTVYYGFGSNLYAFDAQGRQRWKCPTAGLLVDESSGSDISGLGCVPAVATNGTIYVTTDTGILQAISPEGSVKWNFSAGAGSPAYYGSPAIGSDGAIYFGTINSRIYAVRDDGAVGSGLWTNTTLGSTVYASPVVAADGSVFVASANPTWLFMLSRTNGSVLRSWFMTGVTYPASPAVGADGHVYIGNGNSLLGFDPANPGVTQTWAAAAGPVYVAPAIGTNGTIYAGGGNYLYEFRTNGATGNTWPLNGTVKSSPAIDSDGSIIVGSGDGILSSLNPNGTVNWVLALDEYMDFESPLIQRDGTIYISDWRNVYAVCGPAAQARTNWPAARHDVLRTGNAAFDAVPILKPAGLTVTPQGADLSVIWNGNPNADYYELFRGTNDLAGASLYRTLLTDSYTDTNVAPGMIYSYWVRVATPVALSDFSAVSSNGVPPLPPENLAASRGNPTNAIVIGWSASSNATVYYLWHSLTDDTNTAVLLAATTNITSFTNAAITRGRTYYYWVQAGNGMAGISDFSAGASGGTPPLAPAGITASTNSSAVVNIAWSASDYADTYALYRNDSAEYPSFPMAVTGGTNYTDTNATPLLHYSYWVRATNQYGLSEFSAAAEGQRLMAPPLAVCATKGVFTNQVRVSWQVESEKPTSYCIWRNMTNDRDHSEFQAEVAYLGPSSTNYDDVNITRGAGYYYWVQAKNIHGVSELSTGDGVANFGGTVPYPPLSVNASDGTDDTLIMVTWNAADYATAYAVYREDFYTPPSPSSVPLGIAYGTNYYADTNAGSGHIYYYWVKSANQFGRSELSGFNTGWRVLLPPYGLSAGDGASTAYVHVAWMSSNNAATYELWRGASTNFGDALMLANAVVTNNFNDVEAPPGVMFYYWTRAKTSQFISEFSAFDSGWRALGAVDIGVSNLVFLPTGLAPGGSPNAVSFRVTNYGGRDMAAPNNLVKCSFYLSSNSVYGAPDLQLIGATTASVALASGDSMIVVLPKDARDSLKVPAVLPGSYYIFVDIRHAWPSAWLDENLDNNTTSRDGGDSRIGASQPAGLVQVNDYDGDGYTDLAMYQESSGAWRVWLVGPTGVTDEITLADSGGPGFKAVPADYDGDGRTDPAVYQEAAGTWMTWLSAGDYAVAGASGWGGPGFAPVPADYDGDGIADLAVYRAAPSTLSALGGTWCIWLSASGYFMASQHGMGGTGFRPMPGDYDGDGKADPAVYQESTGTWRVWRSSASYALSAASGMGGAGYLPVLVDFDGDGLVDPAVFQAGAGSWRGWLSASGYAVIGSYGMGNAGTVAVPGDFDGDCLTDLAVYWESFGLWRLWRSSYGYQQMDLLAWPGAGFRPVWP